MYRSVAKRLLRCSSSSSYSYAKQISCSPIRIATHSGFRFLSSEPPPPSFPNQSPDDTSSSPSNQTSNRFHDPPPPSSSSSDGSSSSRRRTAAVRANYQEEQTRVLAASLPHVFRLGWSEAAMIAGARDAGLSPSIVGAIPRKEGALVEYFMDECFQKLIDDIDSDNLHLQDLIPSERIAKLVKLRLQLQAPYISKWPQALSIQAQPSNFPTSFKQRAMLVDEFWHASSDEGSGVDWYLKRTVLGGIYSTTEIYMLTDNSTDFNDTWMFLNDRVRDAFDLKKTLQEVKYFAEAVGAGMGGSMQGFMKKAC